MIGYVMTAFQVLLNVFYSLKVTQKNTMRLSLLPNQEVKGFSIPNSYKAKEILYNLEKVMEVEKLHVHCVPLFSQTLVALVKI